jgi:uncharacterized protein YbjT (DUF2867 family)
MKVLLTGATGYIGRRLLFAMTEAGHEVVCLVRDPERLQVPERFAGRLTLAVGNLLEPGSLAPIPSDIDVALYLVHSMSQSARHFEQMEEQCAVHLCKLLKGTRVRQIIYLSGLSNAEGLSEHLRSRRRVEEILQCGGIPVTVFRAGIIIGSGSASFEIIRDLVEKLPVIVAPKFVDNRCQPVGIRDVIFYITAALGNEATYGRTLDIGGPDILTYREMLERFARFRRLKRIVVTCPLLNPRLASYALYFVSSTSFPLVQSLVKSMRNETICGDCSVRSILPHDCMTYDEAVALAFSRIEENNVISSWRDSWAGGRLVPEFNRYLHVPKYGCLTDIQEVAIERNPEIVLDRIWSIGGDRGWYYANRLWELRGLIDRMVGGVGLRRGRASPTDLKPGDAVDFWRVLVADRVDRRLLLYAEMRLPGEAWLEFRVVGREDGRARLVQKAVFRPKGLWGRAYWYGLLPLHTLIFRGMARALAGRMLKKSRVTEAAALYEASSDS